MLSVALQKEIEALEKDYLITLKDASYPTWDKVSASGSLSEAFIQEFRNELNWPLLCPSQIVPEGILLDFYRYIDMETWEYILAHYKLSEKFLCDIAVKRHNFWKLISIHQNLSEEFMRQFAHKLDWVALNRYQEMSPVFKTEFQYKINFAYKDR